MLILTLIASLGIASVHLFAGKMYFLHGVPRSVWLSFAGGISVAYVFLHLLPELAEGHETLRKALGKDMIAPNSLLFLAALVGLAFFYGLERAAKRAAASPPDEHRECQSVKVFWIHMASFSFYNVLIGYLLHHRFDSAQSLALFAVAIALHFVVNDFGMRDNFQHIYHVKGRWVLAAAVMIGWAIGSLTEIPEPVVSVLVAFLAGGIILNALKEELPKERESRFSAFLVGAVGYSILLLAV